MFLEKLKYISGGLEIFSGDSDEETSDKEGIDT